MSSLSQLFSNRNTSKGKEQQNPMASLFSVAPFVPQTKPKQANIVNENNQGTNKGSKIRLDKQKQDKKGKSVAKQVQDAEQTQAKKKSHKKIEVMQEEAGQQADQEQDKKKSRNKSKGKKKDQGKQGKEDQQDENLESTIFVGNVSLQTKKSQMNAIFSKYGKIVKIWFRSIPVQSNKMGPKASYILKKYKQNADTMNAYVKFQTIEEARLATKQNGMEFKQKTLRVSMCQQKDIDYKKTVFVGNLPFDTHEEDFRKHFKHIGKIDNVRLIRNKFNHQGIGIGYIKFSTQEQMQKALSTMNGSKINDREIRVKRAVQKKRLQKKIRKIQMKKQNKSKGIQKVKGFRDNQKRPSSGEKPSGDSSQRRPFSSEKTNNQGSSQPRPFSGERKPNNEGSNQRHSFSGERRPNKEGFRGNQRGQQRPFNDRRLSRENFSNNQAPSFSNDKRQGKQGFRDNQRNSSNDRRPSRGDFRDSQRGRPSRGGFRGGQRGRPSRGGFRGDQRERPSRGGFRGAQRGRPSRGGFRGAQRGRGGFRGAQRGRPSRGGFRGQRGDFNDRSSGRGGRGGFRGNQRGNSNDREGFRGNQRRSFSNDRRANTDDGFPGKRGKKIFKQQKINIQAAPPSKRIILS